MKTLHKLRCTSLSHLEAGQIIKRNLDDLVTASIVTTTDVHIQNYIQELTTKSNLFDQALIQIRKKLETEVLIELDQLRDTALSFFNRQLRVYQISENPAQITAYKALKIVVDAHKDLASLNYEAESNGIDNLLSEFANSTFAPHIATLNLSPFVVRIQTTNNNFKTTFSLRSTDVSSTVVYDAKVIRKAMFDSYTNYINYVLALANVTTANNYYDTILDIINQSRKYFSDLLARREGTGTTPPTNPAL